MKVSAEQVAAIKQEIERSGIINESLRNDILDHLCCVVEIKLSKGKNFEQALQESIQELAPDGLIEIQRETIFLLNPTKIIRMKKIMFTIGLLSAMSMSVGMTFKWLHLPGADEFTLFGFLAFTFLFLPLVAIDYFKAHINKELNEKFKIIFGLLSALLVAASISIRILDLDFRLLGPPASLLLLLSGCAIFTFGFLPFLFFTMYKKSVS